MVVGPQLGMAADMPFGRPGLGAPQTRLLTRHLEEVWFPGHACQCLGTSVFTSLLAGKREVAPKTPRAAVRRDALMTEARAAVFIQPPSVKNSS